MKTVWITKYALTHGIFEVIVTSYLPSGGIYYSTSLVKGRASSGIVALGEYEMNLSYALAVAEGKKDRALGSAIKRVKKLEELKIQVKLIT